MEIENQFHFEIELVRTLEVETEPESDVLCNLVQQIQDLDYISVSGETALHISAKRNFPNSARILLEAGASVNVKGSSRLQYQTPLHMCSGLQDGLEMVRLLLRHGADVNAEDEYERTPLHQASNYTCVEIVQEFLNSGADVNTVTNSDYTPLISALLFPFGQAWRLQEEYISKVFVIVQALLRAGADVNYNSRIGGTALHWAAKRNLPHILRFLLKNKAEVNVKNREGFTPLHDAVEFSLQSVETIRDLIRAGAIVNVKDCWGRTPLHCAANNLRQPIETIREFVQCGALVDALDLKERSALDCAANRGNIAAVQELLRNGAHFKFYSSTEALERNIEKLGIKNTIAIFKELIRYVFVNNSDSLECAHQELEEERVVCLLRKFSTLECNLVDFKDACATEADALSNMNCDCGHSNIWAICMGHQECRCVRNLAILKFLFSGQHSNFDYCIFYKLSKKFLLEVTLNQMSFSEFKESGTRVLLNWPCMKEMERYVSFEDVAAFIQSQRSVMGASGLEDVFTFSTGKSPTESSSEIKPPSPKKLRVS